MKRAAIVATDTRLWKQNLHSRHLVQRALYQNWSRAHRNYDRASRFSVVIVTKRLRKISLVARHHAAAPPRDGALSIDFYDARLEICALLEFAAEVR
jgi:hypothetical protein